MIRRFFLTFLLALGVTAHAQLSTPGLSSSIKNMLNQMGTPAPAAPATKTPTSQPPSAGSKHAPATPAAPAKLANLDFKPSAQVRQKAIRAFIDSFKAQAPQVAQELEASLKSMDVFAEVDKQTRSMFGLTVNNTGDMLAVYFTYVWMIAQGDSGDPTKAQVQGNSQQFKTILAKATPLSEVQKQETADALTLQTLFLSMMTEAYKEEPDKLKEFGQALVEQWKTQGLDLSQMQLTDQGFVRQQ